MSHDDEQADDAGRDVDEHVPSLTADEISEQIQSKYFLDVWGPKTEHHPLPPAQPEQSDFARLHEGLGTMHVSGLVHISDMTDSLLTRSTSPTHVARSKIPAELLRRRDEIKELAWKVFGSDRDAVRWFQQPLNSFKGPPQSLLKTFEGCDELENFLRSLYPDREYS